MELIPFALLLVWLVYVIFSAGRRGQQQKVSWSGAAVRLGLVEGSTKRADELPVLQGTVDGHEVEIMLIWRGTGETRTPYTVVQSRLPGPLPAGLSLTQATFGSNLLTALGRQDIPLADASLDKKLVVGGRHPDAVRELLDALPVRKALRRFFLTQGSKGSLDSRVEGQEVIAEQRGFCADESLDEMVADTVAVVTALTEARVRAWKGIARRRALAYQAIGPAIQLRGVRNGGAVSIETWNAESTKLTVEVPGLDPCIRITGGGGGFVDRDPILGGRICITGDPTVLRTQFGPGQLDGLRGDFMQVFQTWPAATVGEGKASLTLPGEPYASVDAALNDLGLLADALSRSGTTDVEHV
jgi:hypothetical protein